MRCPKCGHELPDNATVCSNCNSKLVANPLQPKRKMKDSVDTEGWRAKHFVILALMIIVTGGLVYWSQMDYAQYDSHMPDYQLIVERNKMVEERREKRLDAQRQQTKRQMEQLKKQREEARRGAAEGIPIEEVLNDMELIDARVDEVLKSAEE